MHITVIIENALYDSVFSGFSNGDSNQIRACSSGGQNQTPEGGFPAVLSVRQ